MNFSRTSHYSIIHTLTAQLLKSGPTESIDLFEHACIIAYILSGVYNKIHVKMMHMIVFSLFEITQISEIYNI